MRVEDHTTWEWPFPVRFLIVRENEDGEEQYLGRCAAVEGLFVDETPPPREILTLRGSSPGSAPRHLGTAWIEGWNAECAVQWWDLHDAEILAVAPNSVDPALVDVVVGAGVREEEDRRTGANPCVRFDLCTHRGEVIASSDTVVGLAVQRGRPAPRPLHLVGCEAAEPLRAVLRRQKTLAGAAELRALDSTGRVMARVQVCLDVRSSRPSVLGGTLIDMCLIDGDLPGRDARPAWEIWSRGMPQEPGLWRDLCQPAQEAWLDLTYGTLVPGQPDRSGGVHHLHGKDVRDLPSLHCALSEAIAGPGGYYGREWNAFKDCLHGGFGVVPPFTLIWHDFKVSQRALAEDRDPETGMTYPEEIVDLLERWNVTVIRD